MNESSKDSNKTPLTSNFEDRLESSRAHRLPFWGKSLLLAATVALASVGYLTSSLHSQQRPPSGPQWSVDSDPDELAKRKVITDFSLTDAKGQKKKLSDFHGRVVILNFWASWCSPCLEELPAFAELERKYHDRGLRVLPVNVEDGKIGKIFAEKFWLAQKLTFDSYFDTSKDLAQQFEVDMLPANFVIDRNGRLAFSGFGANDWSNSETLKFIEGLLLEKSARQAYAQ